MPGPVQHRLARFCVKNPNGSVKSVIFLYEINLMIDQNNYNNDDDKNYHNIDIDNITGIQLHLQRHHDRGET